MVPIAPIHMCYCVIAKCCCHKSWLIEVSDVALGLARVTFMSRQVMRMQHVQGRVLVVLQQIPPSSGNEQSATAEVVY